MYYYLFDGVSWGELSPHVRVAYFTLSAFLVSYLSLVVSHIVAHYLQLL